MKWDNPDHSCSDQTKSHLEGPEHRHQLQDQTGAFPGHVHICVCLLNVDQKKADMERKLQGLEMRCFRKLLGISYRDHITKGVKARIGHAIAPYEDLLTSVKRRKLKWYGHVTRPSGLAKTILQGTVQGGRRRNRQRKRWEDNIKE